MLQTQQSLVPSEIKNGRILFIESWLFQPTQETSDLSNGNKTLNIFHCYIDSYHSLD